MRYFALLYTPKGRREAVTALYVIDAEIRESAQSANHDVAHTRLQWWRAEIDRLVNASPQHPATRALHEQYRGEHSSLGKLHELLVAADMDLARMTYLNMRELRSYCVRSGGAIQELVAAQLTPDGLLDEPTRTAANAIGVGIRQAEIVRDLRQDACDGRIYLPLELLEQHAARPEDLRQPEISANSKSVLSMIRNGALNELNRRPSHSQQRALLRPLCVLATLHHCLLDRIAARNYDVASERIDLGRLEKPWIAWREARRCGVASPPSADGRPAKR